MERRVQCVSYLISSWCFLVVDRESSSFFQGVIFPGHLSAVCLDGCGIVHCFASGGNAYMVWLLALLSLGLVFCLRGSESLNDLSAVVCWNADIIHSQK